MRNFIVESIQRKSLTVKGVGCAVKPAFAPKGKNAGQDFYALGKTYFQENDLPKALDNFLKAKEQHPTGPAAGMVVLVNEILNYQTKDLMNP